MIYGHILGGLGNQLFIYAFYRRLMIETSQKVILYYDSEDGRKLQMNNYNTEPGISFIESKFLFDRPKDARYYMYVFFRKLMEHTEYESICQFIINCSCRVGCIALLDTALDVDYRILKKNKTIYAMAYAQAFKYSAPIKKQLQSELLYKPKLDEKNRALAETCRSQESVCVHIRRGDYLHLKHRDLYFICNDEYYRKAIDKILSEVNDPVFYIFSDDIEWVKHNMVYISNLLPVYINNGGESAVCIDMEIMRSCKHFIMSNSSLSWWAQFLSENQNKVVVAPSRWLNDNKEHRELYNDNWHLINI